MANTTPFNETSIAFPFKIDSLGAVATVSDQSSIYSNKVKAVIGTLLRQRVMRPKFGSRFNNVLWDTESHIKDTVQEYIAQAFSVWLPALSLVSVSMSVENTTGIVNVSIVYRLPNNQESAATVGVIRVDGDALSLEETL